MVLESAEQSRQLPIAVDAMGGDKGPSTVVEGAVAAARDHGVRSIIVGDETVVNQALRAFPSEAQALLSVHHASQVITMEDSPSLAVRGKVDSSMRVAFDLVRDGKASAVVSSGNTGAIMAAGLVTVGTLPGVARPAIASLIPKGNGSSPTVLLDSGANSGCQAFQLVQFALMGRHYAMAALGCENPRVGLLSNGTELSKGNDIIRSAAVMLSEVEGMNFRGFVEGRDIPRDTVDVVVCDGFVGNIVLKAMEGTVELVLDSMKLVAKSSLRAKIGLGLARPGLRKMFKERLDPSAYGGAPLLGLGRVAFKCHGSSSSRAIMNGIRVARKFVDENLLDKMHTALSALDPKDSDQVEEGGWSRAGQRLEKGRKRREGSSMGTSVPSNGERND